MVSTQNGNWCGKHLWHRPKKKALHKNCQKRQRHLSGRDMQSETNTTDSLGKCALSFAWSKSKIYRLALARRCHCRVWRSDLLVDENKGRERMTRRSVINDSVSQTQVAARWTFATHIVSLRVSPLIPKWMFTIDTWVKIIELNRNPFESCHTSSPRIRKTKINGKAHRTLSGIRICCERQHIAIHPHISHSMNIFSCFYLREKFDFTSSTCLTINQSQQFRISMISPIQTSSAILTHQYASATYVYLSFPNILYLSLSKLGKRNGFDVGNP